MSVIILHIPRWHILFLIDFLVVCCYYLVVMKKFRLNLILFFLISALVICLDQTTKFCFEGVQKKLIGNFLWISSVHNDGAAFGTFSGARWWFVAFSFIAIAVLFYILFAKKISQSTTFVISLSLLFSGIVGNLIDRIYFGYVRDFIDFKFSNFAVFNFADSALTIGCCILVVFFIVLEIKDYRNKKKNDLSSTSDNDKIDLNRGKELDD